MPAWSFTEADSQFITRELDAFLPDRIFDAHAHLFCHQHFADLPEGYRDMPPCLNLASYYHFMDWIHPKGCTVGGLFFGLAFSGDRDQNNEFVAEEVSNSPGQNDFAQLIIAPDTTAETTYERVNRGGFVGLKCYHTLAISHRPTWQAPIEAYLPEAQVRVAHELGLTITLHIERPGAGGSTQSGDHQTLLPRLSQHAPHPGSCRPRL